VRERRQATLRVGLVLAGAAVAALADQLVTALVLGQFGRGSLREGYTIRMGDTDKMAIASLAGLAAFAVTMTLAVKTVYWRRPLDRGLVIIGGYAGASLAAGLALLLTLAFGQQLAGSSTMASRPSVAGLEMIPMAVVMAGVYIGLLAILPALPVLIYAEHNGVRSSLFYALSGSAAAVAVLSIYLAAFLLSGAPPQEVFHSARLVAGWIALAGVTGLAGGLAYWLIAGRTAGEQPAAPVDRTT
jgi:hypothetical protein